MCNTDSLKFNRVLAPPISHFTEKIDIEKAEETALTRDVEVQTMYRDAQVQTNPFTPDFIVPSGEKPEILSIANLYFDHGLPAGQIELNQIEIEREQRIQYSLLLPHTDEASFEVRKRMMVY